MKKTVFITGASKGIGSATALYFAECGYDVAINYLNNKEKAECVAENIRRLGRNAITLQGDISDKNCASLMVQRATLELGEITVLVNNAGIAQQKLFNDITKEDWDRMFAVNVGGAYNMISAILPSMIHNKRGSIINVSSMWGISGASCEVHYSASKAALIGLTRALAKELAPSNIRVNCVAPGLIDTEMNKDLSDNDILGIIEETPLGKIGTPKDIAKSIFFLADDEFSPFTTGQILSPNGGLVI